jgi:S-adenosylmethionine decarboxylase
MQSSFDTKGIQISCDMWGVHHILLNCVEFLEDNMKMAIKKCGATIVDIQRKKFEPQGVTIQFLLEESSFDIHTYPEKQFAGLTIYTCGSNAQPQIAIDHMVKMLAPKEYYMKTIIRGDRENPLKVI